MMVEMQAKKTGRQILAAVLAGVMLSAAPAYAAQSQTTEKAGSAVSGTVKLQAEKEQTEGSQEMPGETDSEFSESEAESEIEATVDLDALKEAKNENGLKADDWLPIGSVVRTEGAVRKLMVIGRIVTTEEEDAVYDYVGVPYPEGVSGSDQMYFFNRDQIEELFFIGFQDSEALEFQSEVLDQLGELVIRNHEITEK